MRWIKGRTENIILTLTNYSRNSMDEEADVELRVREIIQGIMARGDEALKKYTEKFDGVELDTFRVSEQEIDEALLRVEPEELAALEIAKANIISYHEKQAQNGFFDSEKDGVIRGSIIRPLEKVGVYVPGGTAAYPSSVLMNVLPAKIAGVEEIVMVTPPSTSGIPDIILAAAKIAGVDSIYQVGGAQAIAALAYGTESVPRVDKIVGPGNIYVALAKKEVFGQVGIDMIAGPSEIAVIADSDANPDFIAADMLSQAEHDVLAKAYLITPSEELGKQVEQAIYAQLETLPRKKIASESIRLYGRIIITDTLEDAFDVSNAIAPEHLEVQTNDPMQHLHAIKNAGSVFLGEYASEPVGDYLSGTNHVLPTSGTARFYSPLGVYDFIKHTQITYYTENALKKEKDAIITIAKKEGLTAHARAIAIRFNEEVD